MTQLAWPLQRNIIRRQIPNHTFGKMRNGGTKDHQGWDLYALPMTPCYAIADGKVVASFDDPDPNGYGSQVILEFKFREQTLYAAYCHLSFRLAQVSEAVMRSQVIGTTGRTGNASNLEGADFHMHFEIRIKPRPGPGMAGRIDPTSLYGRAPVNTMFVQGHGAKSPTENFSGLRVPGVNVLP